MWTLSLISFLLLGGFLLLTGMRFGIPDMVSDTYYQLQDTSGIFKGQRKMGWLFTAVMMATAMLMLCCILDTGKGVQFFAFLGCTGLAFVGCSPNYCEQTEGRIHKAGAFIAAAGCVGWCLSVLPLPTILIAATYAVYLMAASLFKVLNGIWYINKNVKFHPWYWAEVAAFADVFITVWVMGI